jgi:hypothetical protein
VLLDVAVGVVDFLSGEIIEFHGEVNFTKFMVNGKSQG